MMDLFHDKCQHVAFTYRPYRRGRYRCHECGGYRPLSAYAKKMRIDLLEYITKPNFLQSLLNRTGKPITIPISFEESA